MEAQPKDVMFQCQIDVELFARFVAQRERWGMTNREIITRMLNHALPEWEAAEGPPAERPSR